MRVVAALGGNALARRGEQISTDVQRRNLAAAAAALVPLTREHELVLTFGDGPQIGHLLLESETDRSAPPSPLDVVGAEAVGMIGYLLEEALLQHDPRLRVATLVTQTLVAADDPAFASPSKPIGPMYDAATAQELARVRGFAVARDGSGWRRVVPSPEPRGLLEADAVRCLVDHGFLVVASGGGGMPVVVDATGRPRGVEAVVDKDLAAVVLAVTVGAERLLLLTDVDAVYDGFGTDAPRRLERLSPTESRQLAEGGQLGRGSMLPKVEAAARFAERGGTAVIAALADAREALAGRVGTTVAVTDSRASRSRGAPSAGKPNSGSAAPRMR
jgi:carbamate kinase